MGQPTNSSAVPDDIAVPPPDYGGADAETAWQKRLAVNPGDAKAWFALAAVAQQRGDWAAVADRAVRAIEIDPKVAQYHALAGAARFMLGEHAESYRAYEAAVALDPADAESLNNLAVLCSRSKQPERAESLLKQALAIHAGQADTWLNLCSTVESLSGRETDVVEYAREAVRLQPRSPKPYFYLGKALLRVGEPDAALKAFSIAGSLGADAAEVHFRFALCYQLLDRIPDAADEFQKALAANPSDAITYLALAHLLFELDPSHYAAAEEACRLSLEYLPASGNTVDLARARHLLAEILMLQGNTPAALDEYNGSQAAAESPRAGSAMSPTAVPVALPVMRVADWATNTGQPLTIVLPARPWHAEAPRRVGMPSIARPEPVTVPAAYVAEVQDVIVLSGHEPILVDGERALLFDRLSDLADDFNFLGYDTVPLARRDTAVLKRPPMADETIAEGIFMFGHYWANYAHWLTEHMTRFCLLDRAGGFDGVPLLINDGLYPQQMEVLTLLAGDRFPIRVLPRDRCFRVNRLVYPSNLAASLNMRSHCGIPPTPHDACCHPEGMEYLRGRLVPEQLKGRAGTRRLWVSRTRRRGFGQRRLLNEESIEAEFLARGFERVLPETLSFREQVDLFAQAEIIAGASGAGMANMIFAPATARILMFVKDHPATHYYYFGALAQTLGQHLTYVCGAPHPNLGVQIAHADFEVPIERAQSALRSALAGD